MEKLAEAPGVMRTVIDQCHYRLRARDDQGEGPVKKPTQFLTHSVAVRRVLSRRCQGCERHVHLLGGKAAGAAVYPRELCLAICRGARLQMKLDANELVMLEVDGELDADEIAELNAVKCKEDAGQWYKYWGDVSGKELDGKLVQEARKEEI